MESLKVRITFTEPLLGTSPGNKSIYRDYVGSKAPAAEAENEEVEALDVEEEVEKTKTVFPRDSEGRPFLWDYQVKGFFKGACQALRKVPGTKSEKIKAFKKEIGTLIFTYPRRIPLCFEGPVGECERPLRASTPQGERVSIAISEEIPAGAVCEFEVKCLGKDQTELVREWLDYGEYSGIGQWRNSGKGRFTWEEIGE